VLAINCLILPGFAKGPQDMIARLQSVNGKAAIAALSVDLVGPISLLGPFIADSVQLGQ
jgi:hypothetical protein